MEIRRNVDSSPRAREIAKAYADNTCEGDHTLVICNCGALIDSQYYLICGVCGEPITPPSDTIET